MMDAMDQGMQVVLKGKGGGGSLAVVCTLLLALTPTGPSSGVSCGSIRAAVVFDAPPCIADSRLRITKGCSDLLSEYCCCASQKVVVTYLVSTVAVHHKRL
ncbi:hypothetical protein CEUSTIGMA_g11596.t1 [Chlamydomonas eustigma]|uniref:Secreted protein n=1 Tax=Chlamydomonas eustigma TaxID=1157962 RepID=A0A250XMC1_9CHLO|nr:hypothetical protein CEUSTIGMA_g11596.t1 [Chlamydomonas eustigma]|eukprot:GAX84173.1 hypothetical protein CEUSTIGMA_g11596.t1 [Chlamydomonas eustigma]